MIAKNGIDWNAMGFIVYGECPEYKGKRITNKHTRDKNISFTSSYKLWSRLIQIDRGNMRDCKGTLCEEWKQYNNFEKWYDSNIYKLDNEEVEFSYRFFDIDNDYISPNTSVFLPVSLNKIIRNMSKGSSDGLMMNVSKQKNLYSIRLFGETIASSDSIDEITEIRKNILKRQFLDLAEKYEPVLSDEIYEKLVKCDFYRGM